jgi:uncharacterized protein DUF262
MAEALQFGDDEGPFDDDLEESPTDSDDSGNEADPVSFWERRQRELVVSVLNYNLATLDDLIHTKKIDLSPRYQRRSRWDPKRQSALIESFLMNVPVPSVFLNEDDYGKYSVIDGKQRLTAIQAFLRGRFALTGLKVFGELNGKTVEELPAPLRNALETRAALQAIIILRQSDKDVKFEVFKRLNTGGVRLNPQEIRNSTWAGPFNDLVLELSESQAFHRLLGIDRKDRSLIWREMRDAEFVLRYFTFRRNWETFSGGMQRHMDEFMAGNQYASEANLDEMRQDFSQTVDCVEAAFGPYAFQRWVPGAGQWRKQVLAALYDAQMFACMGHEPQELQQERAQLIKGMQALFSNAEFRASIDAATNTPSLFKTRIAMVRSLVNPVVD